MNRKIDESALFQAATEVFSRYGYQRARMGDVSSALGLASGTIYRYVVDKKDLYHKSIAYGFSRWRQAVEDAVSNYSDPLEKLIVLSFTGFSFLSREDDFLRILMEYPDSIDRWSEDDYVKDINLESIGMLRDIFVEGMKTGVFRDNDSDILSETFYSTYMFFVRKIYIGRDPERAWQMVITGFEVLVQGMIDRSIDDSRPHEIILRHRNLLPER